MSWKFKPVKVPAISVIIPFWPRIILRRFRECHLAPLKSSECRIVNIGLALGDRIFAAFKFYMLLLLRNVPVTKITLHI